MIISQKVQVKVNSSNKEHFKTKGYEVNKCRENLEVHVKDLNKGSSAIIIAKCDVCGKVKEITYYNYMTIYKRNEIFACCPKCGSENNKRTNLKRYGVKYNSQREEVKEKKRQTFEQTCGEDNFFKTKNFRDNLKRYNIEKYQVENITQSDYFKKKSSETCLKNYGVKHNSQSEVIKKKKENTNLEKLGVICPFKSEECKEKTRLTNLRKLGVEYPTQNFEVFRKAFKSGVRMKKFEETDIFYQGSYELDFLNLCKRKNIKVENGLTFSYLSNEKLRKYHSDFYISSLNLIIEIKSDYTLNKELELNLKKKQAVLREGYNFLFIVNKNYIKFLKLINN